MAKRLTKARYGINPEDAGIARDKTRAAFERITAEIQPSGYLVGDRFSVADLTAAALLFPLVRPPEAPYMIPPPMPPSIEDLRESLSERPGYKWVEQMYRQHRAKSAEVVS
jgi:glutathione S-transferase